MAGIGFVLQKLASKDDLMGIFRAYFHSAMASTGPWLFTVLALGGITLFFGDPFAAQGEVVNAYNALILLGVIAVIMAITSPEFFLIGLAMVILGGLGIYFDDSLIGRHTSELFDNYNLLNFRVIVIYNLAFSLVLSAPIFMILTRYLADRIHLRDVTNTPSVMLGAMVLLYIIQLPIVGWFYLVYVNLPFVLKVSAIINVLLITTVWLMGVFLTALKDYNAVTKSFFWGMVVALVSALFWKEYYGAVGMLNGFSLGMMIILFGLISKVYAEYNYHLHEPFAMMSWFRKYWELAVGGVAYNAAIWVDKWIMWFAPEAVVLDSKMRIFPDYDSAMFLAYLSIVPAMAIFIFSVETNFFERYQRYYEDILDHMPLRKIRQNHQAIIDSILNSARNFILVQGLFCFLAIVLAANIFELLNISFMQIGIFRLGVLGVFFHVLMLFELIILAYFDNRKSAMWLQIGFLFFNIVFTLLSMHMGFNWYGFGYFAASALSFVLTSLVLFSHTRKLTYHSFVTSNNALRGGVALEEDEENIGKMGRNLEI